jgi:hypothetical protein
MTTCEHIRKVKERKLFYEKFIFLTIPYVTPKEKHDKLFLNTRTYNVYKFCLQRAFSQDNFSSRS